MKRPAFQFYPGDWQRDTALRSCSVGARGLWIEMICVMHQAEPYGHLVVNGRPIAAESLARMVGAKPAEIVRWQSELESAGVYSYDGDTIVSRRMVRDEAIRKARADGGKLGGNPALKDKHKVKNKVNHAGNLKPTPSSSSSVSSSVSEIQSQTHLSGSPPDPAIPKQKKINGSAYYADAEDVLNYLNEQAKKSFQFRNPNGELTANADIIIQRLKQGYTRVQLREVIRAKCDEWLGKEDMHTYLRPETLFGRKKFEQYVGDVNAG